MEVSASKRRLRCKVSSDRDELEALSLETGWTPGRAATRPSEESIRDKAQLLQNAMQRYDNVASYVLHRIFKLSASSSGGFSSNVLHVSPQSLRSAQRTAAERDAKARARLTVFVENLFPYMLPEGTLHYVLWLLLDQDEDDKINFITDQEISDILEKV
jgi:hypothetical protein